MNDQQDSQPQQTQQGKAPQRGPGRKRNPPARQAAKTDEPFTERLFGRRGVRLVHFLIYSSLYTVVFVLTDALLALGATVGWFVGNVFSIANTAKDASDPTGQIHASFVDHFIADAVSVRFILAGLLVAFLITIPIYYWNELRYNRGEWVRTFL